MGFCSKCGAPVSDGAKFCDKCGAPVPAQAVDLTKDVMPGENANINVNANVQANQANQANQSTAGTAGATGAAAASKFSGADHTAEFSADDVNKNKVSAILAYLGVLFFIPLVACPDSKFGRFHANQGLVALLAGIILGVVTGIINGIAGTFFWFATPLYVLFNIIGVILGIACGIYWLGEFLYGLITIINGNSKELPLIGKIKLIK